MYGSPAGDLAYTLYLDVDVLKFYVRVTQYPNYYHDVSHQHLSDHLSELVENALSDLVNSKCIVIEDEMDVSPLNLGILQYVTVEVYTLSLKERPKLNGLLEVVSSSAEFESVNFEAPQFKTFLLLQAHFSYRRTCICKPGRRPVLNSFDRVQVCRCVENQALVLEKATNLLSACVDVMSLPILKRKRIRRSYPTLDVTHEFVKGEYTSSTPIVLQISLSCDVDDEEDEGDTSSSCPTSPQRRCALPSPRACLNVKLEFTPPKGEHALKRYVICDSYVDADRDINLDSIDVAEGEDSDSDEDSDGSGDEGEE
ncbi:hypothetical protein EDB83DRAFT_2514551 [Lactarius deliciosus]|nr:hypothetical protein EDB83DRAFT_2514551 [Lactarius deliciosus]